MGLFVNGLWAYLQDDVIGALWSRFRDQLAQLRDFEELRRMLDVLLRSMVT